MKKLFAAAVAAVSLVAAVPAAATSYLAGAEFDGSLHGSTGVWSYGYEIGDVFTPLSYFAGGNYYGRVGANFNTPLIGAPDAEGALLMHPGEFGEFAVLRFTALFSGSYTATLSGILSDNTAPASGPNGVRTIVQDQSLVLSRPASEVAQTLVWTGALQAGETIDFEVDPRGDYGWDSTRVLASVVGSVPEPASWALMIGGFGAAGAMLRRRRLVTARAQG